jgi:tetratricopeptide (TPR) repeat protein
MTDDLPDYYEALAGAIARLERNDRAARGALYDRARKLLLEEAQAANPPWQLMEIVREQRALEEAIMKAEARFASQMTVPARPRAPMPARPRRTPPPAADPYENFEDFEEDEPERSDADIVDADALPQPPARTPPRGQRRHTLPSRRRTAAPARSTYPGWLWLVIGGFLLLVVILVVLLLRPGASNVSVTPEPAAKVAAKAVPETGAKAVDAQPSPEERERRSRELIARGNELGRAQDYDGAAKAYSDAILLGPVDASVYNNRAFAFWSRGMTDEAIADYNEAIRLEPSNIVALTNRAVAHNFQGNYDAAIRDLDRALALKPDSPEVLNSRCWGRALAGHTQAAVADCNEAIKLRPDDPNTLDSRGFAYLKMGETDRAIADYTAALKLNPKLAGALYGRGIAKVRKGDKKGGEADLAAAKAMRPEIEAIFVRYGIR